MDCTQARDEFAALLDGELVAESRAAVEAHLSQCSDCLRELDGLKRVDVLYRELPRVTAPVGFDEGVREAIRPRVLRLPLRSERRRTVWPGLAVAAIVVVAATGLIAKFGIPGVSLPRTMTLASKAMSVVAPAAPEAAAKGEAGAEGYSYDINGDGTTESAKLQAEVKDSSASVRSELPKEAKAEAAPPSSPSAMRTEAAPDVALGPSRADALKPKEDVREQKVVAAHPKAAEKPSAPAAAPAAPAAAPPSDAQLTAGSVPADSATVPPAASAPELGVDSKQPAPEAKEKDKTVSERRATETAAPALAAPPVAASAPVANEERFVEQRSRVMLGGGQAPNTGGTAGGAPLAKTEGTAATPAPAPAPAPAESKAESGAVAGRTFEHVQDLWKQTGYTDQKTRKLAPDSKELAKLVSEHPELSKVVALGSHVIFRMDDRWYEIAPKKASTTDKRVSMP